jgi:hypothetical protein
MSAEALTNALWIETQKSPYKEYSEEISAWLKFAALDAVERDSKHIF